MLNLLQEIALRSMKKIVMLCCSILLFSTFVFGQVKYESESRIKEEAVPKEAVNYLERLFPDNRKVRWYDEINLDGRFFEGKLKRPEGVYSIKFTESGFLYDIELTQDFDQLDALVRKAMHKQLSEQYDRYRLKKVQKQWLGDAEALMALIQSAHRSKTYTMNFEVVFSGKKGRSTAQYEALFDAQGQLLKINEIATRNLSHLLY